MNYLSVEELSKSYDEKALFSKVTFGLDQGQKAALVGVNGSGKSTLLKMVAGVEAPDAGNISFRKDLVVSILEQHPEFNETDTILTSIFSQDREELNAIRDYELALLKTETDPNNALDLSPLIERLDSLNAWDYEHQIKSLLGKLGIHNLNRKMSDLSGGQRKRVALAQALVVNPDFLILDEPTNHLDLATIEWLEEYLATQNLTLLMVTHDRYFLDRVTNEIIELAHGKISRYKGNYSYFLEKKNEQEQVDATSVSKARSLMKSELEWIRRQPKARGTKAKYRIDAFEKTKEKASSGIKSQKMGVNLKGERQGKKVLEAINLSFNYDKLKLVDNFSYVFKRREKVGVIGPNGIGKSTFLNLLTQKIAPDSGTIDVGQTIKFGYYTQDETIFDPGKKVVEIVQEVAEYVKLADGSEISASQLLNQFLFPPKMQHNFVGKLSGGEKRRLQLLRVLIANPNFLILDEPTNDLDITTLNVLEDYLHRFDGSLIIVSHDRYFMDRLVDHLFVFKGGGKIVDFPGNYSDYRQQNDIEELADAVPKKEAKESATPEKSRTRKLSYNEQREFDEIERRLPELEKQKQELEEMLTKEAEYEKLQALSSQIQSIKAELDELELRWLELSEV